VDEARKRINRRTRTHGTYVALQANAISPVESLQFTYSASYGIASLTC